MRKITYFFVSILAIVLAFSCSNEEYYVDNENAKQSENNDVINQTSEKDGVRYTLKNVEIGKNIITLNDKDVKLATTKDDIDNGIYRLEILSPEVADKIVEGGILYLKINNVTHLRKIERVEQVGKLSYILNTGDAQIADIIEKGSISFDVDIDQVQQLKKKNTKAGVNINFDIFEHIKEYKADGLIFNPNTAINAQLRFEIRFDKFLSKFPMEFEIIYEINPSINPYFSFEKALNAKYSTDLLANLPQEIVKLLGKIEIDMDVPIGSSSLPAKISIDQLNIPLNIFANLSKESKFGYNINGSIKIGYKHYNPILLKRDYFIYENTITANHQASSEAAGEVISDLYFVITPKVSLIDISILDIKGNIHFGLESITAAKSDPASLASKCTAVAKGTFEAYMMGNKFHTTDIFNESRDIWNIGTLDKSITFSNLKIEKPSILPCKSNSFNYEMSVDYRYFVNNKAVPKGLIYLTYDVYDDKNRVIKRGEKLTLTESQLKDNKFTYNLCIPFRVDLLAVTTAGLRPSSYIKNMTFTDSYGYSGSLSDFEVGSPFNKNFWK